MQCCLLFFPPRSPPPPRVQVISPHQVMGIVEIVEHLSSVQDKVYDEPTVLVVDNVTGVWWGAGDACAGDLETPLFHGVECRLSL